MVSLPRSLVHAFGCTLKPALLCVALSSRKGWRDVGSRVYSSEGLFDYALYRNQLRLCIDEGARSQPT